MGLVRSCVLEARSRFLGRIKKQCKNLRRLLLLWFEGPWIRCGRTEVQQKKQKIGRLPRNEKQKGKGKKFDKGKDERSA